MPVTQRAQHPTCVYHLAVKLLIGLSLTLNLSVHGQQFRAVWADVFNSGIGNGTDVTNMVNTLANAHYNAIIFQTVAYMDHPASSSSHGAQYKSSILPWSSRVSASFDPLASLCTYAHSKGIEVHAWLGGSGGGPYRVSAAWPPAGNSNLAAHPEWFMVPYTNSESGTLNLLDGNYLLDMGSPDAQEYIVSIVRELVTNYQIDGINWDDEINGTGYNQGYGYPCTNQTSYAKSGLARFRINNGLASNYTPTNGNLAWSNYRRRFKGELMARCQAEIQSIKTNPRQPLRHTSAPEAYSPSPSSCNFTNTTPYTNFIDWSGMLQNGWIDAAIPQFYAVTTFTNWANKSHSCWQYNNRMIFPGLGAYLNTNAAILAMLQYTYSIGLQGAATYSYGVPNSGTGDWWTFVATNLYTNVVSTPTMAWRSPATATEGIMWGQVKDHTTGLPVDDATVTVTGGSTVKTDGNGYYIATLVPATAGGTVHSIVASKASMISATNSTATAVAGAVMRYDLELNVSTGPVITGQPTSKTVGAGTNVTFTVIATGSGLSYQWQKNTANLSNTGNISGATSSILTITGPSQSDAASYAVIVSNPGGTVTSSTATLTVVNPPAITTQPQSTNVLVGQNAMFSVVATGSSLTYQWRLNGGAISGATTSTYSLTGVQPANAGSYSVVVTNIAGSVTSGNAVLSVVYTLSVASMGSGSLSVYPSQATYTSNATVTITATPNAGKKFLNWAGDATGTNNPLSVSMTTNKSVIAVFSDGVTDIIVDNADATATFSGSWTTSSTTTPFYGSNYAFANTVSGSATSTAIYRPTLYAAGRYDVFMWYTSGGNRATNAPITIVHNGSSDALTWDESINGANSNGGTWTLISSEQLFQTGTNDYVQLANNIGATGKVVMADAIKWSYSAIQNAPAITNQPQSLAVNATSNVSFTVGASGDALSYQWHKNGVALSNGGNVTGSTTATLNIFVVSQSDAASYTVVASNVLGTATSSAATMTVYDPPSITSQPQSDTSLQGQNVFFTVSATGAAPLTYQWRKNGSNLSDGGNISGSTTSALTLHPVGPTDAASYTVTVSNRTIVVVTSTTATLTIVSNVIPLVSMSSNVDGSVSMTWQTDSGTSYTLQYKSNLTDLNWSSLGTYLANSSTLTLNDGPIAGTQRFYQLISSQRASDPAGMIKLSLLGNSDNFISLPFARPGGVRFIVSSVSGNVITADGSPGWTANQFVYASGTQSNTYYARIASGAIEGRIYLITANSANSITLSLGADTLSSLAATDSVAIEPYWTLNTAFPAGAGVIASPTPGNRYTELLMPDTSSAGINLSAAKIYFYNSGIWKQVADGSNVHNDDVLQPNSHFVIRHNVATNTTFTAMGLVVTAKLAVSLRAQPSTAQDNYIGLMRPAAMSLNESGLISSGAFQSSPLPGTRTDELLVFDNNAVARNKSASAVYFYWNTAWRQVGAGSADVGANQIFQPGAGIIIRKYTNNASPLWLNSPNW